MVAEEENLYLTKESHLEDPLRSEMEIEENVVVACRYTDGDASTQDRGEGSSAVFSQEASQESKYHQLPKSYGGCAKKFRFRVSEQTEDSVRKKDKEKSKLDRRLSRQDRIELGRMFQGAVSSHDWELAESLILLADPQTLNDALCIALDSIWFLKIRQELDGITGLIKKIVSNGARDFTRAALRTSFLASCVSACQSRTISLADTVAFMAQRLHDRLQECNGDEILKAEAGAKVQKFTEWALKCIGFHSRCQENRGEGNPNTAIEVHFQLSAFKTFLDLAGSNLSGKDFTEAFDAACFPLTLFSSSFDPGWASGISAYLIQGLLGMLVEGGADNVNLCFLEASRFGSTELVRILLQIAQRNSLHVDVDLALGFASQYGKIGTMECLVEEGQAAAFLGPLRRAAERGCLPVVQWFIDRGCQDMELCLALIAATSSSQVEVTAYLLPHVPQHVLAALSVEIIKAAGERCGGSLDGVAFLLQSNFLGDPAATYAVADSIARSDDEAVAHELKAFLHEQWSEEAFLEGLRCGQDDYVNFMRILKRGESPICLRDLPTPLMMVIAYLPLYKECVVASGCLLPQRLRGQLVEVAARLTNGAVNRGSQPNELLAVLENHLPPFLHSSETFVATCINSN
ncbi:ankyrin repeat protein SKIP35 [Dendrobium catenatum]|uniref:ankyrin repeat protein SKIP35 n=1 Tax=Dendrobium catenatum TaxID=906689 RepID=UPI0009F72F39|nr:ankyrin repeat protein SKIP35 [Dendrobium catenatum]XP_020703733.1 ankyrin repeat protein SKIP35 [Dendrobium catenatum]